MKWRALSKTASFHILLKKNRETPKWCHFERHCSLSSSPRRIENRGRRRIYSPVFSDISPLPLSPKHQKDVDHSHLHKLWPVAYHGAVKKQRGRAPLSDFLGWLYSGHPCLSPLCFTYKYRGGSTKGRDKKRERVERPKERKKKDPKRKKEQKNKEEERKRRRYIKKNKAENIGDEEEEPPPLPPPLPPAVAVFPGKNSVPLSFAFVYSLAIQDVHGAHLCKRGKLVTVLI